MKLTTHIHSTESFGTLDGPGIRYVVFTQGCLLRCKYCHNPDTWDLDGGKTIAVSEIMADLRTYLPFIKASGGGITVSGGEPLLHIDFLIELFSECKKLGIHTAIDSSGGCFSNKETFLSHLDKLMKLTDLVLLDLKHIDDIKHRHLTGLSNKHILEFARYLSSHQIPVWIRHVLVPGITDDDEYLYRLEKFIATLKNVEKIEVLPYHKLGIYKWEALGIPYELENVEPPSDARIENATKILAGACHHPL